MIILSLPAIVMIIGFVWYLLSDKPKSDALALAMFWVGLLVTLYSVVGHYLRIS